MILFPLDKYPEVELLNDMVVLFLLFWGISILFSVVAASIYIPTNNAQRFPFLHIFRNTCFLFFLMKAILTGVRYLIVVLIYISLMISDGHLFMYLLATCISSLKKKSIQILFSFLIGFFLTMELYELLICINPLSHRWFANIFSCFLDFLLFSLMISFAVLKRFNLV